MAKKAAIMLHGFVNKNSFYNEMVKEGFDIVRNTINNFPVKMEIIDLSAEWNDFTSRNDIMIPFHNSKSSAYHLSHVKSKVFSDFYSGNNYKESDE